MSQGEPESITKILLKIPVFASHQAVQRLQYSDDQWNQFLRTCQIWRDQSRFLFDETGAAGDTVLWAKVLEEMSCVPDLSTFCR
ncbi:MAG: hypothetical protein MUC83_12065, partial [Pirellula sp.]|nr:hypothetical protein [Pirellula sp.]